MSSAPLRMVGAMVIEIGGVLLALALLPGLPWEQWKASIASAPSASAYEAAEFPPSLPPSRYGFQLDGQSRQLQERVYTAPAAPAAPQQQPFAAPPPPVVEDRSAVAPLPRRQTSVLPELPAEPQRRQYVAETLDRASQQILDSLAAPWSGDSSNSAGISERELVTRGQNFRAPVHRVPQNEQQYLRPELPNHPTDTLRNNLPPSTIPTPTTRFGQPSAAQPLERSQSLAQPTIPLEPATPKLSSDIAPQVFTAPTDATHRVSPPTSYYSRPQSSQFEGETTSYERPPLSNQYYAPREQSDSLYSTVPSSKPTGPTHVRPVGPRHVQY